MGIGKKKKAYWVGGDRNKGRQQEGPRVELGSRF